jgi:hypothetical protein
LLDRLQKTQNKLVKILFNRNGTDKPSTELMKEHAILSVSKLRDFTVILKNYFKTEHKLKDSFKFNFLREKTIRYKIPIIKNKYGLKCLNHYVPATFNKLPAALINLPNYNQAKRKVKIWLVEN